MAGSRGSNKKARESFLPLALEDKQTLAFLLARGIEHAQINEVLAMTLEYPDTESSALAADATTRWCREVAKYPLKTVKPPPSRPSTALGGMSDASKRGRPEDIEDFSDFEFPCGGASSDVPTGTTMVSGNKGPWNPIRRHVNVAGDTVLRVASPSQPQNLVEISKDIGTMERWGKVLFACPKLREKGWSYLEVVEHSLHDKDVNSYVAWAQHRYAGKDPEVGKITDFVAYLSALNYQASDHASSLERRFKP